MRVYFHKKLPHFSFHLIPKNLHFMPLLPLKIKAECPQNIKDIKMNKGVRLKNCRLYFSQDINSISDNLFGSFFFYFPSQSIFALDLNLA